MASRDETERVTSELEELFADLCHGPRPPSGRRVFRPRVDVYSSASPPGYTVVVELAGVDPRSIELAVADGALVVAGTRRRRPSGDRTYHHMEIDYGSFERRVRLPEPVDAARARATYADGLLTIELPVASRVSRRVTVRITTEGAA